METRDREGPVEIAIVGELTENQSAVCDKLLEVEPGGQCLIYFDSPGGNPYTAMALVSLIRLRGLRATGVAAGECSSAALWPFAACEKRLVTAHSVFLFHPMRWQSEENVGLLEAAEWARHFAELEAEADRLLADLFGVEPARLAPWIRPGRYITGRQMAEAGLAEMVELAPLKLFSRRRRG